MTKATCITDFLKNIASEPAVLAAIRAESRRRKTDRLTPAQIDREIAAFRRERKLTHASRKRRS